MLGKGLESLIPSGGYKKPEENGQPIVRPEVSAYPDYQAPRENSQSFNQQGYQPQSAYQAPVYQSPEPRFEAPANSNPSLQNFLTPIQQGGFSAPQESYNRPQQNSPAPVYNNYPEPQKYETPAYQQPAREAVSMPSEEPRPGMENIPYRNISEQPAQPPRYPEYQAPVPAFPPEREIIPEEKKEMISGYAPRGLSDDYSNKQDAVFQIEVEKIFPNPHQPRRYFDENALNDLANSIREFGIIQPLVVTKILRETENGTDVSYQLIAGERRLMAAKRVGLRTVPAIVKQVSMDRERLELAIIENIQRENLNPLEAARSYARLQDEFGLTQREIAIRMGKSRETIANTLRLLNLPSEVQQALEEGRINESHARLLLQVTDQAKQREMFNSILHFKPSVRELKAKLRQDKGNISGGYANPELSSLQSRLEEVLGTRVQISDEGEKGRIMISYYSPEELNDLIRKLSGGAMY